MPCAGGDSRLQQKIRVNHSVVKRSTNYLRSLDISSCSFPGKIMLSFTCFQKSSMVCWSLAPWFDFFRLWSKMYWFTRHLYFPFCSFGSFSLGRYFFIR